MLINFLVEPNLIPFHLSVVGLVLLSMAETIGYYIHLRPSTFLRRISPAWLANSPLLQVKFSKVLIFVFLLITFSFAGYFLQLSIYATQHSFVHWGYILPPALVISIFFTVFMIHSLDQVIKPKFTLTHINLIGRLATVSSGSPVLVFQHKPGFVMNMVNYIMCRLNPNLVNLNFNLKSF